MKIRTGFVSNSSSSSFLIYGMNFKDVETLKNSLKSEFIGDEDLEEMDKWELIEWLEGKLKIDTYKPLYSSIYVGNSFTDIKPDETRREFESRITEKLKEAFKEVKCGIYSKSWYDG